mgnify:CR=1 FL=1
MPLERQPSLLPPALPSSAGHLPSEGALAPLPALTPPSVPPPQPQVELQGVSLVVLSFFRDQAAAAALADCVAAHGGILGAAVCCAEKGGDPSDDWTTCERDRDELLDR